MWQLIFKLRRNREKKKKEKGNGRDEAQTVLMSRHYVTAGELIIPQSPKRDAGGYCEPDKLPLSVTRLGVSGHGVQ